MQNLTRELYGASVMFNFVVVVDGDWRTKGGAVGGDGGGSYVPAPHLLSVSISALWGDGGCDGVKIGNFTYNVLSSEMCDFHTGRECWRINFIALSLKV
ncbi:hypothetical protein GWI33_017711 [Rhynchophorus ferrugineus]|uniref:Uncharacterized protein n=1 Tax=Rhynchophorus ferrugineus TaxID=354439 RepID=A0A834HVI1_RHYFE|nr:hypothetical protein GWI33_017711 [Rhynchophorus ferrugineus]